MSDKLTVVFEYKKGQEADKWFKEQVGDKICAIKANKDKPVQVTSYSSYDELEINEIYSDALEKISELIDEGEDIDEIEDIVRQTKTEVFNLKKASW